MQNSQSSSSPEPTPPDAHVHERSGKEWRNKGQAKRSQRAPTQSRILLTLAAFISFLLAGYIAVAPLFSWQTCCVAISLDDYPLTSLSPVPFSEQDIAAISDAVAGRCAPALSQDLLTLSEFQTSSAIRDLLPGHMESLPLRQKDILVAYVRGQSLVVPDALSETQATDDPLSGTCCLIANDFSLQGERPGGLVPCRKLVEYLGTANNKTSLIALDLGNLRWDPRLGVALHLVPNRLEEDLVFNQRRASGNNWIITSHDSLEFSLVSPGDQQTVFGKAIAQALTGVADQTPWGDADGMIELHEIALFVSEATLQWSQACSGGRHLQHPVIWKLGVGKIALSDVPKNIPIMRVAVRPLSERIPWFGKSDSASTDSPLNTAVDAPENADTASQSPDEKLKNQGAQSPSPPGSSAGSSGNTPQENKSPEPKSENTRSPNDANASKSSATPATEKQETEKKEKTETSQSTQEDPKDKQKKAAPSSPQEQKNPQKSPDKDVASEKEKSPDKKPSSQPAPLTSNPWELLSLLNKRPNVESDAVALIDFAPHVERATKRFLAYAETDVVLGGSRNALAKTQLENFVAAMQQMIEKKTDSKPGMVRSDFAALIQSTTEFANKKSLNASWFSLPKEARELIAVRNDAIEVTSEMLSLAGHLSGGVFPSAIDLRLLEYCIRDTKEATVALANFLESDGSHDAALLSELSSCSLALVQKTSVVRSFFNQLRNSMFSSSENAQSFAFHELLEVNYSTATPPKQRQQLQQLARSTLSGEKLTPPLPPTSGSLRAVRRDRIIDQSVIEQVSSLASMQLDLFSVAIGLDGKKTNSLPMQMFADEMENAREALNSLRSPGKPLESKDAENSLLELAGCLAQLHVQAKTMLASYVMRENANIISSDHFAGMLRLLDPRDARTIGTNSLISLTAREPSTIPPLKLTVDPDNTSAPGVPIPVSVAYGGPVSDLANTDVVFRYDPALLRLYRADGTPIPLDSPFPVISLEWRSSKSQLIVVPLTADGLIQKNKMLQLAMTLSSSSGKTTARLEMPVPGSHGMLLAVKGHPLTVGETSDESGWSNATRLSGLHKAGPQAEDDPLSFKNVPFLTLRSWPSGVTSWQLGIDNFSNKSREISIAVYSILSRQIPGDRAAQWQKQIPILLSNPKAQKPILVANGVKLSEAVGVTTIELAPPKPDKEASKVTEADSSDASDSNGTKPTNGDAESKKPPPLIGPDLAVVIQENVEKGKKKPAPKVFRIGLEALHPRHFVVPYALYDHARREISISLETTKLAQDQPPPMGIAGELTPLSLAPSVNQPAGTIASVVTRKPVVQLTPTLKTDTAIASWNGPDQGTGLLGVNINEYPRAFVFAIKCSPAMDGKRQSPQRDWRRISFVRPNENRSLVRAPSATIPFKLVVDAPTDTFSHTQQSDGAVEINFRKIGVGVVDRSTDRLAWTGNSDRQISFRLPEEVNGLSVLTTVQDWEVEASGEGFANVDVAAEARLLVAGKQQPVLDARTIVFDGTPPVLDTPPVAAAIIGRTSTIPLRVSDDVTDGFFIPPDRIRPGISGIKSVEWAIDFEGTGAPKEWKPVTWLGDVRYEIRVETKELPAGIRVPLLVRATDRVGLSAPPNRIWLNVAAQPASDKNKLTGRVVLEGRGESDVWVTLTGPSGERRVKTVKNGAFEFTGLPPGEYSVMAEGAVRNTSYQAQPVKVTVPAAPAPAPSTTLMLR